MKEIIFFSIIYSFLSCFMNNEVLANGSANFSITTRIIGGDDADIEDFPYIVSLRFHGQYFCTGVSIDDFDVLSAAHCFTHNKALKKPYTDITVHSGTISSTKTGNIHKVKKVTLHPAFVGNWETSMVHDIAHIKLVNEIEIEFFKKVYVPMQNVMGRTEVVMFGWGDTNPKARRLSETLQKLTMWTLSNAECQKEHVNKLHKEQLCAYQRKGHGCATGDSGGPLIANQEVIGIHSWVRAGFCGQGKPEIFTNVFEEKDFIDFAIRAS